MQQKWIREDSLTPPSTVDDIPFLAIEIQKVIKELKENKTAGLDGITGRMVVHAFSAIPTTFLVLFNSCLQIGYFPLSWKRASIKLIPKSDCDQSLPGSYRLISLLPVLSKVLDKLIIECILWFLNSQDFFNKNQFGFRSNTNTTKAFQQLINFVCQGKDNQQHTAIMAIDFGASLILPGDRLFCTLLRKCFALGTFTKS